MKRSLDISNEMKVLKRIADESVGLYIAAAAGETNKVISFLSDTSFDANLRNDRGWAPIHVAAKRGYLAVVDVLLKHGVCVDSLSVEGEENDEMCKEHECLGGGASPLHLAARAGHFHITELLVARGAQIELRTHKGETALYTACEKGHVDIVKFLIQKNAVVNQVTVFFSFVLLPNTPFN